MFCLFFFVFDLALGLSVLFLYVLQFALDFHLGFFFFFAHLVIRSVLLLTFLKLLELCI